MGGIPHAQDFGFHRGCVAQGPVLKDSFTRMAKMYRKYLELIALGEGVRFPGFFSGKRTSLIYFDFIRKYIDIDEATNNRRGRLHRRGVLIGSAFLHRREIDQFYYKPTVDKFGGLVDGLANKATDAFEDLYSPTLDIIKHGEHDNCLRCNEPFSTGDTIDPKELRFCRTCGMHIRAHRSRLFHLQSPWDTRIEELLRSLSTKVNEVHIDALNDCSCVGFLRFFADFARVDKPKRRLYTLPVASVNGLSRIGSHVFREKPEIIQLGKGIRDYDKWAEVLHESPRGPEAQKLGIPADTNYFMPNIGFSATYHIGMAHGRTLFDSVWKAPPEYAVTLKSTPIPEVPHLFQLNHLISPILMPDFACPPVVFNEVQMAETGRPLIGALPSVARPLAAYILVISLRILHSQYPFFRESDVDVDHLSSSVVFHSWFIPGRGDPSVDLNDDGNNVLEYSMRGIWRDLLPRGVWTYNDVLSELAKLGRCLPTYQKTPPHHLPRIEGTSKGQRPIILLGSLIESILALYRPMYYTGQDILFPAVLHLLSTALKAPGLSGFYGFTKPGDTRLLMMLISQFFQRVVIPLAYPDMEERVYPSMDSSKDLADFFHHVHRQMNSVKIFKEMRDTLESRVEEPFYKEDWAEQWDMQGILEQSSRVKYKEKVTDPNRCDLSQWADWIVLACRMSHEGAQASTRYFNEKAANSHGKESLFRWAINQFSE